MIPSRFWHSAIWFSANLFGGLGLICVEKHAFVLLLVVAFVGAITFRAGLELYYDARTEEELAEARKKLVAVISGKGEES